MKTNEIRNTNVPLKKHGEAGISPVEPVCAGARAWKTARTAFAGAALLLGISLNAGAQGTLTARNDTLRTGPLQTVRKNIIRNDIIPGDTYSWKLLDRADAYGTFAQDGNVLVFTPNASCRNKTFDIRYELSGGGISDTAGIHVIVAQYNNPVNVIYSDLECVTPMPSGIKFTPALKYIGKSVDSEYADADRLDGFSMPLVGDLNGDGKPEIVAMGINYGNGLEATGDKIIILNGQTGQEIYRYPLSNLGGYYKLRYDPRHNSISKLAIADLDKNGIGDIIVTETGRDGRVDCIEPIFTADGAIVGMNKKWTGWSGNPSNIASYKAPLSFWELRYGAPVPYIADLNGDGTPEVIVYNKIYDGVTGELVCTLQTLEEFNFRQFNDEPARRNKIINDCAYTGRRPGASWSDDYIPCMAVADINGDGILDIIAGSKVYIMKDANGKPALDYIIHGPSEITAQRGTSNNTTTTYVSDGFTAVADIDLDGHLEVIVLSPAANDLNTDTRQVLYVWDPMSNPSVPKAALYLYTRSSSGTMSYPFVGDINGKKDSYDGTKCLPEICFNGGRFYTSDYYASQIAFHPQSAAELSSADADNGFNKGPATNLRGHIIGFTYHADPNGTTPLHQRLKLSWAMEHQDESSCTGITMFDFDNDNIKELCYRDENSIRVISPARKVYITNKEDVSPTGAIRFKYTEKIGSYTGFEAPVIADVNMDGSADIITLAHNRPSGAYSKGFVHVFEHASGTDMWAPCPPVWNQAVYFPLLINEDLTVPARPQSMLTSYTDETGETIYPYNGQWIQQPIAKQGEKFSPQVRYPDAFLADMKVSAPTGKNNTAVTLRIINNGSASVPSNAPILFYDCGANGVPLTAGTIIGTLSVGVDIFAGESATLTYNLPGNYAGKLIYACIMVDNRGDLIAGWNDCDPTNNTMAGIDCPSASYNIVAAGDTALCGYGSAVLLNAEPDHAVNSNIKPTYQWWQGYQLLPGETSQTLKVSAAGDYRCYVTESVCRGFTATRRVSQLIPEVHDDYVQTPRNHPVQIDVHKDRKSGCMLTPVILNGPEHGLHHGTAVVTNNIIIYTPTDPNFIGQDSLHYDAGAAATIYIQITELPDNISSATCYVAPDKTVWGIRELLPMNRTTISNYQQILTGDIDNDGEVEILAYMDGTNVSATPGGAYATNGLRMFAVRNGAVVEKRNWLFRNGSGGQIYASALGTMAIARHKGGSYVIIAATDGYLYAYDHLGAFRWKSDQVYTTPKVPNAAYDINLADFNRDGIPEIYTGNRIFSMENGAFLCGGSSADNGLSGVLGCTAVGDMDDDGMLELIAGNRIYKVNIVSPTSSAGNSLVAMTGGYAFDEALPANIVADGRTQVADFDLDGKLEVLVVTLSNGSTAANKRAGAWLWKPNPNGAAQLLGSFVGAPTDVRAVGRALVGNIDSDSYPEAVFIANGNPMLMFALKYDPSKAAGSRLVQKWTLPHTDRSGYTGISLFDFDQDGSNEICYRDEQNLRIINGSGATAAIYAKFDNVTSGTRTEMPVIADVDGDGQAELIVSGDTSQDIEQGYLRVFKAPADGRWAPARKVWNQYSYTSLNVHDDLTVAQNQPSPALRFPGKNGIQGDDDDVFPFNNIFQQQTILDKNGIPLWLTPDAVFDESRISTSMVGDSVSISLCIVNRGDAALGAPVYATLYGDSVKPGNILCTGSLAGYINPGDTGCLTVGVGDIRRFLPLVQLVVRLNDDGRTYPVQAECDCSDSVRTRLSPALRLMMKKDAALNGVPGRGTYPNPVSVLYGDTIEYRITAVNANAGSGGTLVISDTLPAYLHYAAGTATATGTASFAHEAVSGTRQALVWTFDNEPSKAERTVRFKATLESGVSASQPMFVNRAWVTASDTIHVPTGNSTYHQGAGISIVTFSAAAGGELYNARPQALDFRTASRSGILVVPDDGYRFIGWSHDEYMSLRGEMIEAGSGVMQYDTLTIYGNVRLRADFVPEEYPVRYHLNGGENASGNPSSYTVKSDAITLEAPRKAGDAFTGWTGSNGDDPQLLVVIPRGSTGERDYYANYRYSGRDVVAVETVETDRIWSAGDEAFIRTSRTGSIVRIYTTDGVMHEQHTILSAGTTKIRLEPGVYIVTLNNGTGQKILIR